MLWFDMNVTDVINSIVGHSDSPLVAESPSGRVATPMPLSECNKHIMDKRL